MEFPYRSFTFFSVDLRAARAPSNNARHVSASKKHYTAWIEGKHRISIATYRLLDAKRACCAEDTCDQPRSEQTSAVSIYALSTRISSFFFLFQYKIRAIFLTRPSPENVNAFFLHGKRGIVSRGENESGFKTLTLSRFEVSFEKITFCLEIISRRGKVCWMFVR